MTSAGDKNVYDQMKDRWINPLYQEGIGRRTGRQLQVTARRDSEGFENFSDYWSDSAVESDISEFVDKQNNTSQEVTDGSGKLMDTSNRKLSSPLKPMQSFLSGRSSEPLTSTYPSAARHSPSSDTQSHSNQQPSGLDNGQEAVEVNTETASDSSQDMESESKEAESHHLEGAPQDMAPGSDLTESDNVDESNEDVDKQWDLTDHGGSLSHDTDPGSGPSARTMDNKKHTPVQDSIDDADITGSIISVRTSQAPNSALQVFHTKKRLSFSSNEPEGSKTVKKKKNPMEKRHQSPRKNNSNTTSPTDETQPQEAESLKDKRKHKSSVTKKLANQSQKQKRISTKTSSEDDSLNCTLTAASVDSDASNGKRPVDEAGGDESSTVFETNKQTRRSRKSRGNTDNKESQSNTIENKRESRHQEEDHKESSEQERSQQEADHNESLTQEERQYEKDRKESSRPEERLQEMDHIERSTQDERQQEKAHPKKDNTRRGAKSWTLSTEQLSDAFDVSANGLKFLSLQKSHAKTLPDVGSDTAEEEELQDNDDNDIEIVEEAADTTNNEIIRTLKKTTKHQAKVQKGANKKSNRKKKKALRGKKNQHVVRENDKEPAENQACLGEAEEPLPDVGSGTAEEEELQDDDDNDIDIVEKAADTTNNEIIRTLKKTTKHQANVQKGANMKSNRKKTLRGKKNQKVVRENDKEPAENQAFDAVFNSPMEPEGNNTMSEELQTNVQRSVKRRHSKVSATTDTGKKVETQLEQEEDEDSNSSRIIRKSQRKKRKSDRRNGDQEEEEKRKEDKDEETMNQKEVAVRPLRKSMRNAKSMRTVEQNDKVEAEVNQKQSDDRDDYGMVQHEDEDEEENNQKEKELAEISVRKSRRNAKSMKTVEQNDKVEAEVNQKQSDGRDDYGMVQHQETPRNKKQSTNKKLNRGKRLANKLQQLEEEVNTADHPSEVVDIFRKSKKVTQVDGEDDKDNSNSSEEKDVEIPQNLDESADGYMEDVTECDLQTEDAEDDRALETVELETGVNKGGRSKVKKITPAKVFQLVSLVEEMELENTPSPSKPLQGEKDKKEAERESPMKWKAVVLSPGSARGKKRGPTFTVRKSASTCESDDKEVGSMVKKRARPGVGEMSDSNVDRDGSQKDGFEFNDSNGSDRSNVYMDGDSDASLPIGQLNNQRLSWQKSPSELSPIVIDPHLLESTKKAKGKRNKKKSSKVTKKRQNKPKKSKKKKQVEAKALEAQTEGDVSGAETSMQKTKRAETRGQETEEGKEDPVYKIPRSNTEAHQRHSSQSSRSQPSSTDDSRKPTPKRVTAATNHLTEIMEYSSDDQSTPTQEDVLESNHNGSADEENPRLSCVMKMGVPGTTVVMVHSQEEEESSEELNEETEMSSSHVVVSADPTPTPKSILRKPGKKKYHGRNNKRLTLQFFEAPKKKGYLVCPEKAAGLRRTKRTRVQTLDYWRNERPLYERRKSGGFALVGVMSPSNKTPTPKAPKARKRNKTVIDCQTPTNVTMHVSPPLKAKKVTNMAVTVVNPETEQEVDVDAIITSNMYQYVGPSGKVAEPEDPITVCKCLHQPAFSSGILKVRPFKEKGTQLVRRNTMVFYIVKGKIAVTIHNTTQIVQTGDTFFVPQGNVYNIKNLRRDEAKLKFFQLKNG